MICSTLTDAGTARIALLARCVTEAQDADGEALPAAALPDTLIDAIVIANGGPRSTGRRRTQARLSSLQPFLAGGVRHRQLPLEGIARLGRTHAARGPQSCPQLRMGRGRDPRALSHQTSDLPRSCRAMNETPGNQLPPSASGYLARVIAGAFEQTTPIEPRLPSLFEPQFVPELYGSGWVGDLVGEDYEGEAAADRQRPRKPVRRETPSTHRPPLAELVPDAFDGPEELTWDRNPALMRANQSPQAVGVLPPEPPDRGRDQDRDEVPRATSGERTVLPDRPASHETAGEPRGPVPRSQSGVLVTPQVMPARETMREAPPTDPGDRASRRNERSESLLDGFVAPGQGRHGVVAPPPTAARRPDRDPSPLADAASGSEPIVNVTIGRIEVRAVTAQPAPAHQGPPQPKPMSLDEYLQRRRGGQ